MSFPFGDRFAALIGVAATVLSSADAALAAERSCAPGLSTTRAIETTRATMAGSRGWITEVGGGLRRVDGSASVVMSPDGTRYALKLVRGDFQRNGIWAELVAGELASLSTAAPRTVARLFTEGYGSTEGKDSTRLVLDGWNPLRWSEDSSLLLHQWEDELGVMQVVSIDPASGQVKYLTDSARDVVDYALSFDNSTLLYAAKASLPAQDADPLREGFVVTSRDVISLLSGKHDEGDSIATTWSTERFIRRTELGSSAVRVERPGGRSRDSWIPLFVTRISPNGRFAIVDGTPELVPEAWELYHGTNVATYVKNVALDAKRNGMSGFVARQAKVLHLVDLKRATSQPLWPAPITSFTAALWSPDSRSVILAPTFLPPDGADDLGLQGKAIVELEIATRRVRRIPVPADSTTDADSGVTAIRWAGRRVLEIEKAGKTFVVARPGDSWRAHAAPAPPTAARTHVRVELRQDIDTPPVLYAVEERTGNEKAILDLNAGLQDQHPLGKAEIVAWQASDKIGWTGLLFYPLGHDATRRYPLVIQTHGHASVAEFSLYGNGIGLGLGPGTSVYAGRLLAAHDIAVLTVQDHHFLDNASPDGEAPTYMRAYESAVSYLSDRGLVDATKVGISGFSRTGWHVEYALAHSEFLFAAAITSDNVDGNYLQQTFFPASTDPNVPAPFGDGLAHWLEQSPAFNAQRLRTPLRLMAESAGLARAVIGKWEMFSRLRQLDRPVEFYVIPRIDRGSHGVQNPTQVFAAQQGTVDWFNFWLNDCVRFQPVLNTPETAESLSKQYVRWRKLRDQRDALSTQARPPPLRWLAEPKTDTVK